MIGLLLFAEQIDSHRQIIVLPPRHLDVLVAQHGERAGDAPPRRVRHDHLVDIAALGGDEGRQEAVLVFLGTGGDLVGVADVGARICCNPAALPG